MGTADSLESGLPNPISPHGFPKMDGWEGKVTEPATRTQPMRTRPILFSGEMVRAILEGRKSQTRRIITPQPMGEWSGPMPCEAWPCPYGQPGDQLWVREAWTHNGADFDRGVVLIGYVADGAKLGRICPTWPQRCGDTRNRPSIHMPRWASRITLEILKVRVERVQDISEADAIAEGVDAVSMADIPRQATMSRRADFAQPWNKINAKRGFGWDGNPWVWVLEFKVDSR